MTGKQLRKRVCGSKGIDLKSFLKFAGEKKACVSTMDRTGLAKVPLECPSLPSSFRHRPHAEAQLAAALLDGDGRRSTSLTAPKSRISSQGMGQYRLSCACVSLMMGCVSRRRRKNDVDCLGCEISRSPFSVRSVVLDSLVAGHS